MKQHRRKISTLIYSSIKKKTNNFEDTEENPEENLEHIVKQNGLGL